MSNRQNNVLLVGDEECTCAEIVNVISKHPIGHILLQQYTEVARILHIPQAKISEIQNQIILGTRRYSDVFVEILMHWRMQQSDEATLDKLVKLLQADFPAISKALKRKFYPTRESPTKENPNPDDYVIFKKENPNVIFTKEVNINCLSSVKCKSRNDDKSTDQSHKPNIETDAAASEPFLDDAKVTISEQETGQIPEHCENSNDITRTKRIKKWKQVFYQQNRIHVACYLLILLVFMVIIPFYFNQREPTTTTQPSSENEPVTWKPIELLDQSISLPIVNIFTSNYKDYREKITQLKTECKINLTIIAFNSTYWDHGGAIFYPTYLVGLNVQGYLPWGIISSALKQTYELRSLAIENYRFDEHFSDFLSDGKTIPAFPFKLQTLVLRNISSCVTMFSSLANSIKINSVNTILIREVTIDDDNIESLGKMIRQSENLNHLEISSVAYTVKPVSHFVPLENMSNLKNLTFELISPTNVQSRYPIFDESSPWTQNCRLERLIGKYGYVDYPDILYCKDLKHLNISVKISENVTFEDVSVFVRKLPKLECLVIFLDFATCPENELGGWQLLQECLPHFEVRSECIIKKPKSTRVIKYVPGRNFRKPTTCENNGARKGISNKKRLQ